MGGARGRCRVFQQSQHADSYRLQRADALHDFVVVLVAAFLAAFEVE